MNIKQIVKQTILKYADGYINPFDIASNMDCIIIKEDLGKTNGYYYYYKRNHIIGINHNLNEKEQIRVCSHELGHAIMHHDINYSFLCKKAFFTASKYEKEADLFAIHLMLSKYDEYDVKDFSLEYISRITNYPLNYINKILL